MNTQSKKNLFEEKSIPAKIPLPGLTKNPIFPLVKFYVSNDYRLKKTITVTSSENSCTFARLQTFSELTGIPAIYHYYVRESTYCIRQKNYVYFLFLKLRIRYYYNKHHYCVFLTIIYNESIA